MQTSYRFTVFGEPRGPWRATREEAWADALDEGMGEFDDYTDRVWIIVPGSIWATHDDVDPVPRQPARRPATVTKLRPKNGPTSEVGLSRIERIIARREGRISAVS